MSYNTLQNRLQHMGPVGTVTLFLASVVLSGAVWLLTGNLIGTFAGGLCLGLMLSTKHAFDYKSPLVEAILLPICFIVFLGLYLWKSSVLMPADWEPSEYAFLIGVFGFIVASGLSVAFGTIREDGFADGSAPPPVQSPPPPSDLTETPRPRTRFENAAVSVALMTMGACTLFHFAQLKPEWLSTSYIALHRHIITSIYAFGDKQNLAYYFAGLTSSTIQSTESHGDTVTAIVKVTTPVVPFDLKPGEINTRATTNKYFDLPTPEKPYATLTGKIVLQKSGLGWKVVQDTFDMDPVALSRAYRAGELYTEVSLHPRLGLNIFGISDSASSPFNIVFVVGLIFLSIMILSRRKPESLLVACLGVLVVSTDPLFLITLFSL